MSEIKEIKNAQELFNENSQLKQKNEALKMLYNNLLDFGQDNKLPKEKIDFVKARVFDTTVLLNRIEKSFNTGIDS